MSDTVYYFYNFKAIIFGKTLSGSGTWTATTEVSPIEVYNAIMCELSIRYSINKDIIMLTVFQKL